MWDVRDLVLCVISPIVQRYKGDEWLRQVGEYSNEVDVYRGMFAYFVHAWSCMLES